MLFPPGEASPENWALGGCICLLQTLPLDLETCHIWHEESRANNRAPYLKTQHGCHVLPSSSETQYHPIRLGRPTTVSTLRATTGRVFDVLFLFMSSFLRRGATVSRVVVRMKVNSQFIVVFGFRRARFAAKFQPANRALPSRERRGDCRALFAQGFIRANCQRNRTTPAECRQSVL